MSDIEMGLNNLKMDVTTVREDVEAVKDSQDQLWNNFAKLVEKNDYLENQDRRMNVVIHGLQEKDGGEIMLPPMDDVHCYVLKNFRSPLSQTFKKTSSSSSSAKYFRKRILFSILPLITEPFH